MEQSVAVNLLYCSSRLDESFSSEYLTLSKGRQQFRRTDIKFPLFEPKNVKKTIPNSIVFNDNLKEWWDKNEYKDIDKQFAIFSDNPKPDFLDEYKYLDDYDDESYEECKSNS